MSLLGQLPWWKFPIFVAVQIFGSFIAAAAVYALYYGTQSPRWGRGWARSRGGSAAARLCPADAIWSYSNGTLTASGPRETASIFATYPAEHLSLPNGFLDQVGAGPIAPYMDQQPGPTAPHGPAWPHTAPCGPVWLHTALYGPTRPHMAPHSPVWPHTAPYRTIES